MSETTTKCPDCGRPLLTWNEGQLHLMELMQRHFADVENMARLGDQTGDPKYNTKELTEHPVHDHVYAKAFVHWLAAHEQLDLKMILELAGQMAQIQIVAFIAGQRVDVDDDGGLGGLDPHTKH